MSTPCDVFSLNSVKYTFPLFSRPSLAKDIIQALDSSIKNPPSSVMYVRQKMLANEYKPTLLHWLYLHLLSFNLTVNLVFKLDSIIFITAFSFSTGLSLFTFLMWVRSYRKSTMSYNVFRSIFIIQYFIVGTDTISLLCIILNGYYIYQTFGFLIKIIVMAISLWMSWTKDTMHEIQGEVLHNEEELLIE